MFKSSFLILNFLFIILIFPYSSYAFDDGDFQYWNSESISWEIDKYWNMDLQEEFRFGDDIKDFYYQHSDLGTTFSGLGDWLDLGINYRLIFEEKGNDWRYENRPHLNSTVKFDLGGFNFSSRNRFESRFREKAQDGWRYRNKFTIKLLKMTKFEIQPYIADEIFIDFIEEELNRNRLYGGISVKLLKNLKGEIFYIWQSSKKNTNWIDYNVFGTSLKLRF